MSDKETLNILLVEDSPTQAIMVESLLEGIGGYHVEHVEDLASCLKNLMEEEFDAVLLDLFLPDSGGMDTVEAVCGQAPLTPIVILTSHDNESFAHDALSHGAEDYLAKDGINAEALERSLRHAIQRKKVERRLAEKTAIIEMQHAITAAANEAASVDEAIQACLDKVCEHMGWLAGHTFLRAPGSDDGMVSSKLWCLKDSKCCSNFKERTENVRLVPNKGFTGRALAEGKPIWIADVANDPNFARAEVAREDGIVSGFALPVFAGQEIWAVLEFFSAERKEPDEWIMEELTYIGTQIGRVFEREESAEKLRAAMKKAEAASVAKSEFLANMSHELRTPLNSIMGFAQMMEGEFFGPLGDEKYADYVKDIYKSGAYLLKVVNDILDVSAIEAGETSISEDNIKPGEVVQICVKMVSKQAAKAKVDLSSSAANNLPHLLADETRVKQILINLLSNSIKFTPAGGKVNVGAQVNKSGGFEMIVSDTGIGISPENIDKVLEPFIQARDIMTRAYEGVGLGLSLTNRLVELHGGALKIESEIDKGTTVTVSFPPERTIT